MSELMKLKSTINSIAGSAKQTAGNLGSFNATFSKQRQSVEAAIKGSSQRKDQEVLNALSQADKQVKAATAALQNAAQIASRYGASL